MIPDFWSFDFESLYSMDVLGDIIDILVDI